MSLTNPEYFTNLTNQVKLCSSCAELQSLTDEVIASLQSQKDAIQAEIDAYAPMIALLTLSISDLPSVITFLENLVENYLTPQLKPYITLAAQLTEFLAAVTSLASAIEAAASSIKGCTVTVPPVV